MTLKTAVERWLRDYSPIPCSGVRRCSPCEERERRRAELMALVDVAEADRQAIQDWSDGTAKRVAATRKRMGK